VLAFRLWEHGCRHYGTASECEFSGSAAGRMRPVRAISRYEQEEAGEQIWPRVSRFRIHF
jgi:hypothetical protein